MERGYLVALLSILAVFTGVTHGLRSFEQWSERHLKRSETIATSQCHASSAAKAIAKLKTQLRPHYAEEAQLLAELNLPARVQSERVVPSIESSMCERARAMQEAERARREMLRTQRDALRMQMRIQPIQVNLPPDFERQVQESTAAAMRLAQQQIRAQIQANRARAITSQQTDSQQ